jgi:hypothetical protein
MIVVGRKEDHCPKTCSSSLAVLRKKSMKGS